MAACRGNAPTELPRAMARCARCWMAALLRRSAPSMCQRPARTFTLEVANAAPIDRVGRAAGATGVSRGRGVHPGCQVMKDRRWRAAARHHAAASTRPRVILRMSQWRFGGPGEPSPNAPARACNGGSRHQMPSRGVSEPFGAERHMGSPSAMHPGSHHHGPAPTPGTRSTRTLHRRRR
jgi:hypothetical protein